MNLMVKEVAERVYETAGVNQLSMRELLYLMVGKGTKNHSLDDIINAIMQKHHDYGLRNLSIEEIESIPGVGRRTAERICGAVELGRKAYSNNLDKKETIKSPEDAANLLQDIKHERQEHFVAIYLDSRNNVLARRTIFIGSLNSSVVHPREVYREAVKLSAASLVVTTPV